MDYIVRATDKDNKIRIFAALTTDMVEMARKTHNTTPVATAALGRTLTATSIMGTMMKSDKDKLTITIKGNGPIGSIVAVSNSKGVVKGYVSNPDVDVPLKYEGKLDVSAAVGKEGSLTVIKDLGLKKPYIGKYELVSGEIAEDFTAYFAHSEQQPSAVALGVLVDVDYSVKAAGGFIVQLMPDASEEVITTLENNLSKMEPISTLIDKGKTPEDIIAIVLDGLEYNILEKHNVKFECDCSRERIEKALITLGENTLSEILHEDKKAEVVCHFCNEKYQFSEKQLKNIIENMG
ncbi:molecular chaperone Hsp33 [Alkalithermobacter thermoalcaliphilus JW-YL-7 = DSM 7308]|uniref:33 kDa chaperonin n=1 Tax=Alkalithermobacter thermoalcaliphilus JW-YL-7 = DSM 7308 TaxID=1121328 RepID=A0A150FRM5_CLOPD|nr:33 kDa chaperonin [[Clostridium] paradoxum JW-YL-7 = DSM 7308]SHK40383.1 molecular chaperone Hsp33 [[Clostridium] paradoxum JW-YL-7 = DSM 7308]